MKLCQLPDRSPGVSIRSGQAPLLADFRWVKGSAAAPYVRRRGAVSGPPAGQDTNLLTEKPFEQPNSSRVRVTVCCPGRAGGC